MCAGVSVGIWARGRVHVHVALVFQHASTRHIVTSFAAPKPPPYFSTLSHKRCDFRKNVTEHKICVLIFSTTFVQPLSQYKNNSARYYHKCEKSPCKVPVILVGV
jgi:hypothetical protein